VRGMTGQTLHDVTRATTIGRLMYASPSWWGFLSENDLNRLESFVRHAKRGGFLSDDAPSFRDIAARADSNLFGFIISRDVPVNHPVLDICRVSHYLVLPGPGKIIDPSKFFFQSKY